MLVEGKIHLTGIMGPGSLRGCLGDLHGGLDVYQEALGDLRGRPFAVLMVEIR